MTRVSQFRYIIGVVAVIIIGGSLILHANFDDYDYQKAVNERRYQDALTILNSKPDDKRTVPEKELLVSLTHVIDVEVLVWPKTSMALAEDDMDPQVVDQVKRYMIEANRAYLSGNKRMARLILLQVLYVYPDYPKARHFLDIGFQMFAGTYQVVDQVDRLLKRSDHYFYGGNYLSAAEDLEILAVLAKGNPIIYEKLGSAYYMMNLKKKAIDTWSTALFYNPDNAPLDDLIQTTKADLLKESSGDSELAQGNASRVVIDDPQTMGVFKKQSDALTLMRELQAEGLRVAVDENSDQKWVVQVSRQELMEKNKSKGRDQ